MISLNISQDNTPKQANTRKYGFIYDSPQVHPIYLRLVRQIGGLVFRGLEHLCFNKNIHILF